jgi:DNA-binding MarR family transcriptional regulator
MDAQSRNTHLPKALDQRVTYLLRRVTDAAGRKANAALAPLGFDTRHYTVLTVVAANPGPSQRTIADTLRIDRATVVALIDGLEDRGLIRRARSRQDRRANTIRLTAAGRQALETAHVRMAECEESFLSVLPEAERTSLASILERLFAANAASASD